MYYREPGEDLQGGSQSQWLPVDIGAMIRRLRMSRGGGEQHEQRQEGSRNVQESREGWCVQRPEKKRLGHARMRRSGKQTGRSIRPLDGWVMLFSFSVQFIYYIVQLLPNTSMVNLMLI